MKETHFDVAIQRYPTNFIRSGYYNYSSGSIANRNGMGYYWEPSPSSATNARSLGFTPDYLYTDLHSPGQKGLGRALRCLVR